MAYGPVNCFDATGNLIIVIECKIGAFFKKKCWLLGHIQELSDCKSGKIGQSGLKMGQNINV